MAERRLYSVSDLATELQRDRRTMGDALRNIAPDGELRGRPTWFMMTAISALYGERTGARERKLLAEAGLAELLLAQRRGELASIQVLVDAVDGERVVVREHLLGMLGKLSGRLSPEDVQLVEDELYEVLEQLSAGADLVAGIVGEDVPDPGKEDLEATPAPEPDPVGGHVPARSGQDVGGARTVANGGSAGRIRPHARR